MSSQEANTLEQAAYGNYVQWKGWDRFFSYGEQERRQFEGDLAGLPMQGRTLLEIGFGSGALLAWARDQGALVSGCERTAESVAAAQAHGIPLVEADFAEAGGLAPDSLDYAVAIDVFEHMTAEEVRARLFALAAALKPGGRIVLRYPNGQSPFGLSAQHGDITHKTPLSRAIVEQLAAGSGLQTERYAGASYVSGPGPVRRAVSLARALMRRMIVFAIQQAFANDTPLDAVVVQVLVKKPAANDDLQPG